jgi:methylase of polypeptide subunit release factors
MRKHFFSSLYLFERCQWLLNLAQRKGNIHFIDIGCGPGTSGIALVDYFHSNSMNNRYFYYSGVDCYDSMLNCAKEFLSHRSIDNLTTTEFVKNLSSINLLAQHNINSIIINTCYLFASPSLDVSTIANEMNKIFDSKPDTPKFLLYQNTTEIEKNRKYNLFKTLINPFETLLSENVSIKYNNQRNSYYTPVSETVYIEVLKF